jgi:hypothetical protein
MADFVCAGMISVKTTRLELYIHVFYTKMPRHSSFVLLRLFGNAKTGSTTGPLIGKAGEPLVRQLPL